MEEKQKNKDLIEKMKDEAIVMKPGSDELVKQAEAISKLQNSDSQSKLNEETANNEKKKVIIAAISGIGGLILGVGYRVIRDIIHRKEGQDIMIAESYGVIPDRSYFFKNRTKTDPIKDSI